MPILLKRKNAVSVRHMENQVRVRVFRFPDLAIQHPDTGLREIYEPPWCPVAIHGGQTIWIELIVVPGRRFRDPPEPLASA